MGLRRRPDDQKTGTGSRNKISCPEHIAVADRDIWTEFSMLGTAEKVNRPSNTRRHRDIWTLDSSTKYWRHSVCLRPRRTSDFVLMRHSLIYLLTRGHWMVNIYFRSTSRLYCRRRLYWKWFNRSNSAVGCPIILKFGVHVRPWVL